MLYITVVHVYYIQIEINCNKYEKPSVVFPLVVIIDQHCHTYNLMFLKFHFHFRNLEMEFEYVAVGHHPTDVVVISTGYYAEIFSFIHYERHLDRESSSSSGASQLNIQDTPQHEPKAHLEPSQEINNRRKRSRVAIKRRRRLYKQRRMQREMNN